jgi:hypothetical protein
MSPSGRFADVFAGRARDLSRICWARDCATLEIHANEGFMDRRYDINQNPNAVGRATRRWYSFQGPDRLTLRVDAAELLKPVVETLFIWERVSK